MEHRVFNHEDEQELHDTLERDAFKYKNSSVTHETTHSSTTAPAVASEHVHHHVHEHVQPIVQKETVAPEVIHTTIPLHETHHVKAVHHGTSTLPPKTMEEWKKEGGVLGGRVAHTLSDTSGCPAPYKTDFQKQQMAADKDMHSSVRGNEHAISAGHNMGGFASTGSNDAGISKGWPENSSLSTDKNSHYSLGSGGVADTTGAAGIAASSPRVGAAQVKERQKVDSLGVRSGSQAQTNSRASLVDKLNPFKDADGDGKKGVMD